MGDARRSMAQNDPVLDICTFLPEGKSLGANQHMQSVKALDVRCDCVRVGFHFTVTWRQRRSCSLSWERDGAGSQGAPVIEPLRGPCSRLRVCCASLECCSYS